MNMRACSLSGSWSRRWENRVDEFCLKTAASNFNPDYVSTSSNLAGCWLILLIFVLVFALLSMLVLTGIDSDRR